MAACVRSRLNSVSSELSLGRLADIFGRRLVIVIGLAIFGVVSIVCGSAPDEWFLVDSTNPKVAGFAEQAKLYADFFYQVAKVGAAKR